jgi:hypothetical protein
MGHELLMLAWATNDLWGRFDLLTHGHPNGRNRRISPVAARSGDGLLTIRFAELHHRAMQTGGLVSW